MTFVDFLTSVFPKSTKTIRQAGYLLGQLDGEKNQRDREKMSRDLIKQIKFPVGCLVISCDSSHPMHLVEITRYEANMNGIPFGRDLITGEDVMLFSTIFNYTENTVRALAKLEMHERLMIANKMHCRIPQTAIQEYDVEMLVSIGNAFVENAE